MVKEHKNLETFGERNPDDYDKNQSKNDTVPNAGRVADDSTKLDDVDNAEDIERVEINAVDDGIRPHARLPEMSSDFTDEEAINDVYRAQIDTGAWVSCTGELHLLHDYTKFGDKNPCPVKLMPATDGSDATPRGIGYLHVRAPNEAGFLAVECFYHEKLRGTLIDERDLIIAAGTSPKWIEGETIQKFYESGKWTWTAKHKTKKALNIVVHGILVDGKCFTDDLILPTSNKKIKEKKRDDPEFEEACKRATLFNIFAHQEKEYEKLRKEFETLPTMFHSIPFHELIQKYTPVQAIRRETERLLWHQRLGHPSDYYLYNAHRHIKGVPKFKHLDPILEQCPTCIRAKQTKESAGPNSTRSAAVPYQGLSIDFSFAGVRSKDPGRAKDFVGFNGETCWILVSDHFSRMLHGDTRISKASPVTWLREFLKKYAPQCEDKYVVLDQGGELYANPIVRELFEEFGYEIRPTGADSSNENGPVERAHLTMANGIRAMLTGANLDVRFWPYAFHHYLRIQNATPSRDQAESPIRISQHRQEDFSDLRTFGCRVWIRPPGRRQVKFRPNSRKGVFLGYVPRTTKNILWFDPETSRVKLAKHARFDEGMNDLPPDRVPPNVVHLQRTQQGEALPAEAEEATISEFDIGSSPFAATVVKEVRVLCKDKTFGFAIESDEINNRAFVSDIKNKSSAAKLYSTHKATKNKIRGAYVVKINGIPIFTKDEALAALKKLRDWNENTFEVEFAPERKMSAKATRTVMREHKLHQPESLIDEEHVHVISIADVRAIATARYPGEEFSPEALPISQIALGINAIRSDATTADEQSIGRFTRRKLKRLTTWPMWEAGERKQLNQFHDLKMYGEPIKRPPNAIVLRQHWQYHIKRDGTRRARNCCDGSPRAAPALHKFVQTYSSCVEQPVQRLFFAIAAEMSYQVYGGDAKDAYAHSPPPDRPTFVEIDDAYADWYKFRFGVQIDRSLVLPVQHALQGHPESGKLWERHISAILKSTEFNFRSTTHDRSIYRGDFEGIPIFLLRQVDDFALAAPNENIAINVYDKIGKLLQLPSEDEPPFSYLGQLDDFNGVDVLQYHDRTVLSCGKYIDRVMRTHKWNVPSADEDAAGHKPTVPIPAESISSLYSTPGVPEGSKEYQELTARHGFSYRTLLGELLYAYVTCRPHIGYAVIALSKFATCPGDYHFSLLKKVAKYLRRTRHWGIHFRRTRINRDLPVCPFESVHIDPSLPDFPVLEPGFKLACFVDAAHANDLRRRRSTTGYAFIFAGGCVSYKCKTQPLTATSSTEAEFYAAVSAAKHARYLRSILIELGFAQPTPTPLYCDNESAINMINARIPTDRSRHILIQYFAIQDWKETGDIIMRHIPGILNPADDLTKPLGWILHSRHCRRLMGHY